MFPWRRSRLVAGVMFASLAAATVPGVAFAQPLSAPNAAGGQAGTGPAAGVRRSDEREAVRLLVDAEAEIAQGDPKVAVRLLELMIARYPATLAAERGRARIASLEAEPASAKSAVAAPGQPQASGPGGNTPAGVWRTRIQATRTAAEAFRRFTGDRVFFGEHSSDLGGRARLVLAAQARWLKANPAAPVVVEAHADDHGTPTDNLALAARRGEAVRRRLVEEGVAAARIRIAVIGNKAPAAGCGEALCAAQNRRVVTLIAVRSPLEARPDGLAGTTLPPDAAPAQRPAPLPGLNALGGPLPSTAPR